MVYPGQPQDLQMKIAAIGMGSPVTASSCWAPDHGVDRCRLNFSTNYGSNSWCAKVNDANQWLQVNFGGEVRTVTEIHMQGRHAHPQWVKQYQLKYTNDGINWEIYCGGEVFEACHDENTIVPQKLPMPIQCRAIRICPTSWHGHISIRCEVFYLMAPVYTH